MSNEQTALLLVPRAELAQAQKDAAEQAKRANSNALKSAGIAILGTAAVATFIHVMPIVIAGACLEACGYGGMFHYDKKLMKYKEQQATASAAHEKERAATVAAADQARREALRMAAETILTQGAGTYIVGQGLRIEVANETPNILRIENIGTGLNDQDRPVHQMSGQLYEMVAQADGSLKRGKCIANIPAITYSMPLDPDLAVVPPLRDEVEKKLPPCTPRPA